MNLTAIAGVATIALVLSPAGSIAAPKAGDQSPAATPYAVAQNGPHIGDGSTPGYQKTQKKLLGEPGYSVGTGAAVEGATTYHDAPATAPQRAVEGDAQRHQN